MNHRSQLIASLIRALHQTFAHVAHLAWPGVAIEPSKSGSWVVRNRSHWRPGPGAQRPPKVLTDDQTPVEPLAVLDLMREGR